MVVTPQLALRVAILGGDRARRCSRSCSSGSGTCRSCPATSYLAEANDNRVREIKVEAPRGKIVDRNGTVLVDNRTALSVQVQPERLPRDDRRRRASCAAARPRARHAAGDGAASGSAASVRELPFSPVTLKTDVGLHHGLLPRRSTRREFPGVDVERGLPAQVPATTRSARTCSGRSAR